MTEQEFLSLPSRELDAVVAEAMGLDVITRQKDFPTEWVKNHEWVMGNPKKYVTTKVWNDNFSGVMWGLAVVPHFSTSIADAWDIILKLQGEGKSFRMGWDAHELNRDFFISNFSENGLPCRGWVYKDRDIYSEAQTAPLAICLAFLKVKGVVE